MKLEASCKGDEKLILAALPYPNTVYVFLNTLLGAALQGKVVELHEYIQGWAERQVRIMQIGEE